MHVLDEEALEVGDRGLVEGARGHEGDARQLPSLRVLEVLPHPRGGVLRLPDVALPLPREDVHDRPVPPAGLMGKPLRLLEGEGAVLDLDGEGLALGHGKILSPPGIGWLLEGTEGVPEDWGIMVTSKVTSTQASMVTSAITSLIVEVGFLKNSACEDFLIYIA